MPGSGAVLRGGPPRGGGRPQSGAAAERMRFRREAAGRGRVKWFPPGAPLGNGAPGGM